jgi:cyclic pyranopterin phosphate synthase
MARIFVALGVRKLRLTGGEPLLRKDIEVLIASWPGCARPTAGRWTSR